MATNGASLAVAWIGSSAVANIKEELITVATDFCLYYPAWILNVFLTDLDAAQSNSNYFICLLRQDSKIVAYATLTKDTHLPLATKAICFKMDGGARLCHPLKLQLEFKSLAVSTKESASNCAMQILANVSINFESYLVYGFSHTESPLNGLYEQLGAVLTDKGKFLPAGHEGLQNADIICYTWHQ